MNKSLLKVKNPHLYIGGKNQMYFKINYTNTTSWLVFMAYQTLAGY